MAETNSEDRLAPDQPSNCLGRVRDAFRITRAIGEKDAVRIHGEHGLGRRGGRHDRDFAADIDEAPQGAFEFKYLEQGTYTIFAYEDCATCDSGEKEVLMTIELGKKETLDIGEIILKK